EVEEKFDRIVSVGMMEHVGQPQYPNYFRKLSENLKPDGVALVHTIGRSTPPGRTSPWIHKYIFPGGYAPAMSETMREIEKQGLIATDVEVWRGHYGRYPRTSRVPMRIKIGMLCIIFRFLAPRIIRLKRAVA
ncbi:MAG: methyltransferase domain-containing protein, partial [Rhodobacteraceae bacterium]|nr:methyltransferase domain-containing protein [Paracoccaceae bacterium]